MKTGTLGVCNIILIRFAVTQLQGDYATRFDNNNNVIWTININDCPANTRDLFTGEQTGPDCDCEDTTEAIAFRTPCCGITPEQCAINGAISDIDGLVFVPTNNPPPPSPSPTTSLSPEDAQSCSPLSPPYIFTDNPNICYDLDNIPRYIAYRAPGQPNQIISHSTAQAICELHGTTLATINPFDRNFGGNILESYLRQYRDVLKACILNNNVQPTLPAYDPCWVGALFTSGSNQGCYAWQLK